MCRLAGAAAPITGHLLAEVVSGISSLVVGVDEVLPGCASRNGLPAVIRIPAIKAASHDGPVLVWLPVGKFSVVRRPWARFGCEGVFFIRKDKNGRRPLFFLQPPAPQPRNVRPHVLRLRQTVGTRPPINDLRFVNPKSRFPRYRQTRRHPHRTIHIRRLSTASTNHMMMVVVHPVFIQCRRSGRLNTPN